jgi:hypothetical protein
MTKQRPRRARVLTNLKIDEISAVDAGAGEGVKIVMMKRDRAALKRGEPVFEPPVEDDESHDDEINDTSGEPTRHLNELVEQLEQRERAMKSKSLDVIKVCKAPAMVMLTGPANTSLSIGSTATRKRTTRLSSRSMSAMMTLASLFAKPSLSRRPRSLFRR